MLAENFAGYSCGNCLGTLVSLVAYRAWRDRTGRDSPPATPAVPDAAPADSIGAKKCPKCRSLMSKYRISAEKTNRLDYCPHCEEIWLDDGEWQLVESLVVSGRIHQGVHAGVAIRGARRAHAAMEEQRLRELLGGDYDRVAQFAEWLQTQPAKQEILARLARRR